MGTIRSSHEPAVFAGVFVGRRAEFDAVAALRARGARLITLLGPAGVGKTRLAMQLVTAGPTQPPLAADDVYFCDLTAARTADAVLGSVLRSLGLPPAAEGAPHVRDPVALVGRWLRGRGRVTVVLDNVEQVCELAAPLVLRWWTEAPEAIFLVTSRQRLGVADEHVVPVAPLSLPEVVPHGSLAQAPEAEVVARSEAVQLFAARIGMPVGELVRAPEHRARVVDIVRALEGMPLALELAAARLEVMPLTALHARMTERFTLLRDPAAPPGARHGTLWDAIEWSWTLLAPAEQRLLADLSVFAGAFSLDAAEAVAARGAGGTGATPVLDGVHGLVRRSLLQAHRASAAAAVEVDPRFRLWVSVREFAAEKLRELGGLEAARKRHARWALERAERFRARTEAGAPDALAQLTLLEDDLHAVLDRAEEAGPDAGADNALRAALALENVLLARGTTRALAQSFERAMALAARATAPDAFDPLRLAQATLRAGWAWRYVADVRRAEACYARALEQARACGARALEGDVLRAQGALEELAGRRAAALALYKQGLAALEAGGAAPDRVGQCLSNFGMNQLASGDFRAAEASMRRALALAREGGNRRLEGVLTGLLGTVLTEEGRLDEARALAEEALAIHRAVGNARAAAIAEGILGIGAHLRGERAEAARRYASAVATMQEAGDQRFEAYYRYYAAALALEAGDAAAPRAALAQVAATLAGLDDRRYAGIVLAALACAHALAGDAAACGEALARARAALEAFGDAALSRIAEVPATLARVVERAAGEDDAGARSTADALARVPADDVRVLVRVLAAELDRRATRAASWVFQREGWWFRPPGAGSERVSLARRPTLARVVRALLAKRIEAPGEALEVDAVVAATWDDVKAQRRALSNRVHVAMSTLRRMGLEAMLERAPQGYRLAPAVPVVVSDEPAGEGAGDEDEDDAV